MSYSNYEQTVIIDSIALSGVQDVNGSYGISETPVKIAGVGFVDALVDAPLEGTFSVSRTMVSADPLLKMDAEGDYLFDTDYVSGAILYDGKGFGFTKGRITNYAVSCSVGELPTIATDIKVFGNLGSGIGPTEATEDHPPIRFPNQGSISIFASDIGPIEQVTDFSFSRTINLRPVYAIPKGVASDWDPMCGETAASSPNQDPIQIDVEYPIETEIEFTMIANKYQISQMKDSFSPTEQVGVVIDIKDAVDGTLINSFTGQKVRRVGERTNSSVEGEISITLSYKGYEAYHNI